jgi:antitoxin Phd
MRIWQLQEAKARFSEVVRLCLEKGPQGVSVRGKEEVIIISKEEYSNLAGKKPNFVDFINQSPLKNANLKLTRDKSLERAIDL